MATLQEQEEASFQAIWEKLNTGPEPRYRSPTPMPQTTHVETWAPADAVSDEKLENALEFRTRFYIDAGYNALKQPQYAKKAQLTVRLAALDLSEKERARLLAVAYPFYDRKRNALRLSCNRYHEPARNKAELRQKVRMLLADARENADSHAETPDARLPLSARSRPWKPGDHRMYVGRPHRKLNKGTRG